MKVIIPVIVVLTLAVAGFIGFVVMSHDSESSGTIAIDDGLGLVATVSHGDRVDIKKHLEPGTLTVIEFYADW